MLERYSSTISFSRCGISMDIEIPVHQTFDARKKLDPISFGPKGLYLHMCVWHIQASWETWIGLVTDMTDMISFG